MLNYFVNVYWAHPVAISAAAIAVIIVLVWMTGSGSRQRFIVLKRTKETETLARDLSRIASALERIAKQREIPTDYVGRPIPPGWEETISSGVPLEDDSETGEVLAGDSAAMKGAPAAQIAEPRKIVTQSPAPIANPLGGTATLLGGKKKLDLPNPLYRPK